MRIWLALLLTCQLVIGCEADGLIWMPPTNTAGPLFRFVKNGRAGFIDRQGHVVVQPTLEIGSNWGQYFSGGLLSIGASSGPFIDATGRKVIGDELARVWEFSDGLAAALKDFPGSQWGYVDRTGAWAIPPQFPSYPVGMVSSFSEGLATVETNGTVGFIDKTGKFAIPQQFVAATPFEEGVARVAVSGPCSFTSYEAFDPCIVLGGSVAPATGPNPTVRSPPRCQWSFIDKSGKRIFDATFEAAMGFHDGLAAVRVSGRWGFINRQGAFVIPPRYESVRSFSEGRALVSDGVDSGFIDSVGKMHFRVDYSKAESFSEGVTVVGHPDDGYIILDEEGRQVVSGRFILASRFFHGLAHVKVGGGPYAGGEFAYIDRTGKRIFTYTR